MTDDQFAKLFKYIEEMRAEINARFEETVGRLGKIERTLDRIVSCFDTSQTEQAARDTSF
jgi:hypothetical protein